MVDLSKIRIIAKEKNISLTSLAERAGMSYQGLNKLMRTNSTTIETLVSVSDILGVSPCYFFGEQPQLIMSPAAAEYLRAKDQRIEELIAENARLNIEVNSQKKQDAPPVNNAECADVG